jgi:hypothetical protein
MRRLTYLGLATMCAASLPIQTAHACGGFFCSSSPIDQAGETIVYGLEDDGTLTMAVQLRYAGDDDDFAWIMPVPAPPRSPSAPTRSSTRSAPRRSRSS